MQCIANSADVSSSWLAFSFPRFPSAIHCAEIFGSLAGAFKSVCVGFMCKMNLHWRERNNGKKLNAG